MCWRKNKSYFSRYDSNKNFFKKTFKKNLLVFRGLVEKTEHDFLASLTYIDKQDKFFLWKTFSTFPPIQLDINL